MSTKIYELIDPRTGEVKYVGRTKNPAARLGNHIGNGHLSDYDRWIIDLIESGHKPEMRIIKTVPDRNAHLVEDEEIKRHIESGANLVNCESAPSGESKMHKVKDLPPKIYTVSDIADIAGVTAVTAHRYALELSETSKWRRVHRGVPHATILIPSDWSDDRLPPENVSTIKWLEFINEIGDRDSLTVSQISDIVGSDHTAYKYIDILAETSEWEMTRRPCGGRGAPRKVIVRIN